MEVIIDKLDIIFSLQKELRILIGKGKDPFINLPDQERGVWVDKMLTAIIQEACEARDNIYWKWWSEEGRKTPYSFKNKQALKLELVDMLFFLLDAMAGIDVTSQDVYDIYYKKWKVNMDRQINDYSINNKNELDNEKIENEI